MVNEGWSFILAKLETIYNGCLKLGIFPQERRVIEGGSTKNVILKLTEVVQQASWSRFF